MDVAIVSDLSVTTCKLEVMLLPSPEHGGAVMPPCTALPTKKGPPAPIPCNNALMQKGRSPLVAWVGRGSSSVADASAQTSALFQLKAFR